MELSLCCRVYEFKSLPSFGLGDKDSEPLLLPSTAFFYSRIDAELVQGAAAAVPRGRPPPSPFRLRSVPWVSSRCPPLPSRAFGSSNRALNRRIGELRREGIGSGHGAAVGLL